MYLGAAPLAAATFAALGAHRRGTHLSSTQLAHTLRDGSAYGAAGPWWSSNAAYMEPGGILDEINLSDTWTGGEDVSTDLEYPLHEAALDEGQLDVMGDVLRAGKVNPNELNADGETAFTAACFSGNQKAALTLLDYELREKRGDSDLAGAKVADMLWKFMYSFPSQAVINDGAQESDEDNTLGFAKMAQVARQTYPDQVASRTPYYTALQPLLGGLAEPGLTEKSTANIDAPVVRDERGRTPLHYAAHNPTIAAGVTKRLLTTTSLCANMTTTDGSEWAPLHVAAMTGNIKAAKALLQLGGRAKIINQRDARGRTPYFLALHMGKYDMADLLRARGGKLY